MKERPIIFTPENGQKIHEGTKTQTRRLNRLSYVNADPDTWRIQYFNGCNLVMEQRTDGRVCDEFLTECPYGMVGDRLWIREALYRKGDVMTYLDGSEVMQDDLVMPSWGEKRTIPSIHMPRWACRTVVEITEIRVERVNGKDSWVQNPWVWAITFKKAA